MWEKIGYRESNRNIHEGFYNHYMELTTMFFQEKVSFRMKYKEKRERK
jgi:hypothetical protein